jgi:hypothetical protein
MIILLIFAFLVADTRQAAITANLVSVKKIWDVAPHNAFTDLIRFKNRWYLVFREGAGHALGEGKLRVLASSDGDKWSSAALIEEKGRDLRDAKFSITSDGRLMLNGGSADPLDHGPNGSFYSVVTFSSDGRAWSPLERIAHNNPADDRFWLWRAVWHEGTAYGVAYMTESDSPPDRRRFNAFVCSSRDGVHYRRLTDFISGATEAAIDFDRNDVMTLVVRGSSYQPKALLMQSRAPYTEWTKKELTADTGGDQIGGPAVLRLGDGRLLGAGRRFSDKPAKEQRTGLFLIDEARANITNLLLLPSGGDTSYPGLVWHGNRLWMSYYSSHEGKSAIYLAEIALQG